MVKDMARRKKKQNEQMHLKMIVLALLFFSYIIQPYMPETEKTFAHSYYADLFSEFYETLKYDAGYAYSMTSQVTDYASSSVQVEYIAHLLR